MKTSTKKLEVLDLIINVLVDHEKELDKQICRMKTMLKYYEPFSVVNEGKPSTR